MKQIEIIKQIKLLLNPLQKKRKLQLLFLITLMLFSSIAETLSIGAALPFLQVLIRPESIYKQEYLKPYFEFYQINNAEELILPITVIFCVLIVISCAIRLLQVYFSFSLVYAIASDLSRQMFKNLIEKPYEEFIKNNSSELISGLSVTINNLINHIISPLIVLVSSIILFLFLSAGLLIYNPKLTLVTILLISMIYYIIIKFTKNKLQNNSQIAIVNSSKLIKYIQETYGNIKEIIIRGSYKFYIDLYNNTDYIYRKSQANTQIIALFPRYIVETLGILILVFISLWMINSGLNAETIIPTLGIFALAAQKLLPLLQAIYYSWANINGSKKSLEDCLHLLESNNQTYKAYIPIKFENTIEIENVSYAYDDNKVLDNVSLSINKGDRVGIIGESGSGKSTLINIILGLLNPTTGSIKVDGISIDQKNLFSWQKKISHIPQNVFLIDASLAENIILFNQLDENKLSFCIKTAQLSEYLNEKKLGLITNTGERGAKLSGGQIQRIGIARALYNESEVLIFDEATSALDKNTEKSLINAIYNIKEKTIIVITHKETTIENFNKVYKIMNKKVVRLK